MGMISTTFLIPEFWNRACNWASKTQWGFRIVGAGATLKGKDRMN